MHISPFVFYIFVLSVFIDRVSQEAQKWGYNRIPDTPS